MHLRRFSLHPERRHSKLSREWRDSVARYPTTSHDSPVVPPPSSGDISRAGPIDTALQNLSAYSHDGAGRRDPRRPRTMEVPRQVLSPEDLALSIALPLPLSIDLLPPPTSTFTDQPPPPTSTFTDVPPSPTPSSPTSTNEPSPSPPSSLSFFSPTLISPPVSASSTNGLSSVLPTHFTSNHSGSHSLQSHSGSQSRSHSGSHSHRHNTAPASSAAQTPTGCPATMYGCEPTSASASISTTDSAAVWPGAVATSSDGALPSTTSLVPSGQDGIQRGFALNKAGIIGVSIASVVLLILLSTLLFFTCRRYRQRSDRAFGILPPPLSSSGPRNNRAVETSSQRNLLDDVGGMHGRSGSNGSLSSGEDFTLLDHRGPLDTEIEPEMEVMQIPRYPDPIVVPPGHYDPAALTDFDVYNMMAGGSAVPTTIPTPVSPSRVKSKSKSHSFILQVSNPSSPPAEDSASPTTSPSSNSHSHSTNSPPFLSPGSPTIYPSRPPPRPWVAPIKRPIGSSHVDYGQSADSFGTFGSSSTLGKVPEGLLHPQLLPTSSSGGHGSGSSCGTASASNSKLNLEESANFNGGRQSRPWLGSTEGGGSKISLMDNIDYSRPITGVGSQRI